MFGSPEVNYHQTYSTKDWLSILRTPPRNSESPEEAQNNIFGNVNCTEILLNVF
jgi:hypothetical protein